MVGRREEGAANQQQQQAIEELGAAQLQLHTRKRRQWVSASNIQHRMGKASTMVWSCPEPAQCLLSRKQITVVLAVVLANGVETNALGRHVHAHGKGLVRGAPAGKWHALRGGQRVGAWIHVFRGDGCRTSRCAVSGL